MKFNKTSSESNCTIALISHASKVMLKILQARLQQYVNHELSDDWAGFRKGRGTRSCQCMSETTTIEKKKEKVEEQEIKLPTSTGS